MNLILRATSLAGVLAAAIVAAAEPRVLVVGVDGYGGNYAAAVSTPNFHALALTGGSRFDFQNEGALVSNPPPGYGASGVNWSTITTGASAAHHGVSDNSFSGSQYDGFPHFFQYVRQVRPDSYLASIVNWAPINEQILLDGVADLEISGISDLAVRDAVVNLLQTGDPDAIFVHFDQVDAAGHSSGWGSSAYFSAIQTVDAYFGTVLGALAARPGVTNGEEDWLVIVTADHGGIGLGHDASQGEINWNVPFIIGGPSVPDGVVLPRGTLRDVAATALWHLEVDPFATSVDGAVRGIPFGPPNGLAGDVNQDGTVSGDGTGPASTDDVTAFVAGWRTTGHDSVAAAYFHGDLNLDRITDLSDWILLSRINRSLAAAAWSALQVPEPTGALPLTSFAAASLAFRRKFRRLPQEQAACRPPLLRYGSVDRQLRMAGVWLLVGVASWRPAIAEGALSDDLAALYQFNGNLLDSSGSPLPSHGVGVNEPQYAAGKVGAGLWLPGVRDYMSLNVATHPELDFGSTVAGDAVDFSIAMWIRQDNALSDPAVLSNKDWSSGANTGVNWAVNGNGAFDLNTKADVGVRRDLDTAANSRSLGVGVWNLVTVTVDRNGPTRLFINGTNTGTIPVTSAGDFNSGLPWNVGQDGTGAYAIEFNGAVDELAFWRRELTSAEALQLWNGGAGIDLGAQVVESALKLVVNRDTGEMVIENNTGVTQELTAYEIVSTAGALNPAQWQRVAGRLDVAGDGSLDADDRWVTLSRAGSAHDFSEGSLGVGAIPTGGRIALGTGAWSKYFVDFSDLSFRYAPPEGDQPLIGLVDFVGNGGAPFGRLDLDFDGEIALGDYHAFLTGYGQTLQGASPAVGHNRGDLNGDGRHSVSDFLAFRTAFDEVRGAGALAALGGSAIPLPEPGATPALTVAILLAATKLRKNA